MSDVTLKSLALLNFKNWEELHLSFSPVVNCFIGPNGVGKTNILDSIHFLCTTKSFLSTTDIQCIRFGADYFFIKGEFDRIGNLEVIQVSLKKSEKKVLKRNDSNYQRLSEHIGLLPVIVISPQDTNLIYEGSDERRKTLDLALSLSDGLYLHNLQRYNRLLQQRNAYLKEADTSGRVQHDILTLYDEQMDPFASYIYNARNSFLAAADQYLSRFYYTISSAREHCSIRYQSDLADNNLAALLAQSRQKDRELLYTTRGVHKDDLEMYINGQPLKKFGSQGQQKSFLIALKLAIYAVIKEQTGLSPILLFDDIFDKLDQKRASQVIRLVQEMKFGQIFLSDTHPERVKMLTQQTGSHSKFFMLDEHQKITHHEA
ncbi:DNA replication/repair protein RecF [Schleiferia thermophila]|uniref:DNA replication/repair protein RecF n=1 Tax=Schleiferia thermophila TaxID=884107 RepID=UPI0004E74301|nr:DNA replication/repair protein RecF [Schleiferia thermophila]KFD39169.1 DNA repair protein RecF [Schleiferia thermophila str. Yellowstone]